MILSKSIVQLSLCGKKKKKGFSTEAFLLFPLDFGVCKPVKISLIALFQHPCNTKQPSLSQWYKKILCFRVELFICVAGRECSLMFCWLDIGCFLPSSHEPRLTVELTISKRWKRKSYFVCFIERIVHVFWDSHAAISEDKRIPLEQGP